MRISFLVAGAALFALPAASAPVGTAGETLDQSLAQARSEAASADADVRRLEVLAANARNEAQALRVRQLAAAQAIAAAEARISAADSEIRLIAVRQRALRKRLAREQRPVSALLAGLSIMADRPPLLSLAGAGSNEELVRIRVLVDSTLPVIRERTRGLSSQLAAGARLQAAATAARERLDASRAELAAKRSQFAGLERQALATAAATQAQALDAGDLALSANENADVLGSDVGQARTASAIAAQLGREPSPPPGPGSAIQPSAAPFAYQLPAIAPVKVGLGTVSGSGVRSRGVTLATWRGTTIVAPGSGTIRFAGPFRDFDGVVIIDHGQGWLSLLVNVASQLERGDAVTIGAPIGRALGPIDVELSRNGRRLSPAIIAGSSRPLSKGQQGS